MKKMFTVQIVALIFFTSGFAGLIGFTDVYSEVKETIVIPLCLSCIKMYPKPKFEFKFETNNDISHPSFIYEELKKGPVFLAYRKDVCDGCDIMDPIVEELLGVDFDLDDHEEYIDFEGTTIYFRHINVDRTSGGFKDSYEIYGGLGVPQFVVFGLGEKDGEVQPYYRLEYGTLGLQHDNERKEFLRNMILEAITHYNENIDGYSPI